MATGVVLRRSGNLGERGLGCAGQRQEKGAAADISLILQGRLLEEEDFRLVETTGEEPDGRIAAETLSAVGIVEALEGIADRVHLIVSGPVESLGLADAEIAAQRALKRGNHDALEFGPILPVGGAFRESAIGIIAEAEGALVALDGFGDHGPAHLRISLPDGQGAGNQTGVADLVPVVRTLVKPLPFRRLERIFDERLLDQFPGLRAQGFV